METIEKRRPAWSFDVISNGYRVTPTLTGGYVLEGVSDKVGLMGSLIGAFSSAEDLIVFLAEAHEEWEAVR